MREHASRRLRRPVPEKVRVGGADEVVKNVREAQMRERRLRVVAGRVRVEHLAPRETLERPSGVAGLVQIGAHVEIVRFRQKPQGVDAVATPKPQKRGAVLRPVALPHLGRLLFGETEFLHQKAVHPIVQGDEKAARRTKNRIVEIDEPKLHGGALRRDRHPSFFAAEKYRHTHSFRKKRKNPTEQRILFSCVLLPGFG